jgi:hypothetical protein
MQNVKLEILNRNSDIRRELVGAKRKPCHWGLQGLQYESISSSSLAQDLESWLLPEGSEESTWSQTIVRKNFSAQRK